MYEGGVRSSGFGARWQPEPSANLGHASFITCPHEHIPGQLAGWCILAVLALTDYVAVQGVSGNFEEHRLGHHKQRNEGVGRGLSAALPQCQSRNESLDLGRGVVAAGCHARLGPEPRSSGRGALAFDSIFLLTMVVEEVRDCRVTPADYSIQCSTSRITHHRGFFAAGVLPRIQWS